MEYWALGNKHTHNWVDVGLWQVFLPEKRLQFTWEWGWSNKAFI